MASSLKRSRGNMYDWVTHMWAAIIGCTHQCVYCYVKSYRELPFKPYLVEPFPALDRAWKDDKGNYHYEKNIFVVHEGDMFCDGVPPEMAKKVLSHCVRYNDLNEYVFQSKNPMRIIGCEEYLPKRYMVGTTIETNRQSILDTLSKAPPVKSRAYALARMTCKKFVTIEPIMDFDVQELADIVCEAKPDFVNIGADSKGNDLPEPKMDKVLMLVEEFKSRKIEIRKKGNLERLMR